MSSRVVDIKEYWSPVVGESLEFTAIADAENPEFNYLWEKIYGLVDEFFVKSATEYGVSRMEKILNIAPQKGESLQSRKDRLIWKMNLRIPYTMRFLKNILASVVGEENREVEFDNDIQTLTVRIKEGLWDTNQLRNDLEKIIPANLVLRIGGEFKKDAFKVVGNPTITSDGIASGFSDENYLITQSNFGIPSVKSWSIRFPTLKIDSLSKYFWSTDLNKSGIVLMIGNTGRIAVYISSNGSNWDISTGGNDLHSLSTFKIGECVDVRLDFTGDKYILYILKDGVWQEQTFVNSQLKISNFNYFKIGQWITTQCFEGSMDLKHLSITVNGKEICKGAY